jgi:hypothetical protein
MFDKERLQALAERVRPTAASGTRLLPVLPAIGALLPDGGLRRGTVVRCTGPGALSLALAVSAGPSAAGSWCGLVGVDDAGVLAAAGFGVDLDRLVVVRGAPAQWALSVGTLLDGVDLVVAAPPARPRPAAVRALAARARERGGSVLVVERRAACPADLELAVTEARWHGLAECAGRLQARRVTVVAHGRGSAVRPVAQELWLPTATGKVAAA